MNREPLVMVCVSDIAGQVRGKGFPAKDLPDRLVKGIGWTPTNIQITAFRHIASTPFGPFGDLQLIPDPDTETKIDFGDGSAGEHFFLADIVETDGTPWDCCLRHFLRNALEQLEEHAGLRLCAAFEHEFYYSGGDDSPSSAYSLKAVRKQGIFAEVALAALDAAGLQPDTFLPEYGPCQYEVTVAPQPGLKAADHAVILRELIRASAARMGESASFAPMVTPDVVGNGVHIHMSLQNLAGKPVSYDKDADYGLSRTSAQFIAGILKFAPALVAVTAPSEVSYRRLVPHRWSAAYNNLGYRDREACVRICPVFKRHELDIAQQYNFEFRAADAAASPYFQLAILVHAGLQGIKDQLPAAVVMENDPDQLSEIELRKLGVRRLPLALDQALNALQKNEKACAWFPERLLDVYLRHKRSEIELLRHLSMDERCAKYSEVY